MDTRDVQSRLSAAHPYEGKVDGDIGGLTKAAIKALLLQQGVSGFDAWPISRRLVAAQQLICRIDGIEVGNIDGLAGAQTRYAIGVHDARKTNGGKPVPTVEAWRDDATAPQAEPSRTLPAITSSKSARRRPSPSGRNSWRWTRSMGQRGPGRPA